MPDLQSPVLHGAEDPDPRSASVEALRGLVDRLFPNRAQIIDVDTASSGNVILARPKRSCSSMSITGFSKIARQVKVDLPVLGLDLENRGSATRRVGGTVRSCRPELRCDPCWCLAARLEPEPGHLGSWRSGPLAGDRPSPVRDVTLSECLLQAPYARLAVVLADTYGTSFRHRGHLFNLCLVQEPDYPAEQPPRHKAMLIALW